MAGQARVRRAVQVHDGAPGRIAHVVERQTPTVGQLDPTQRHERTLGAEPLGEATQGTVRNP